MYKENKVVKSIIFSPIKIDHIKDHKFKDDCLTAQLRQIVTRRTVYPARINYKRREFNKISTRICWFDVSLDTTYKDLELKLNKLPNARIYQIVTTDINDILTVGQKYFIDLGELLLEDVQEKKFLKDNLGNTKFDYKNKQIYRACFFSSEGKQDVYNLNK